MGSVLKAPSSNFLLGHDQHKDYRFHRQKKKLTMKFGLIKAKIYYGVLMRIRFVFKQEIESSDF